MASNSHLRRMRRALLELERAREAVARALAERQDPWRVEELRARERELAERATAVEDENDRDAGPRARTGGTPWPVR